MKQCPVCKRELQEAVFYGVGADFCPQCLGLWFEEDELRQAKDEKDRNLRWLDIDLWKDKTKFKLNKGIRLCPVCRFPLYEIYYDDSSIIVDICNLCYGVWLDRGEFKKIIDYLKEKADMEVLSNYTKNLTQEMWEVFLGPESLRDEMLDVLTILKLLNYKLMVQHPDLAKLISELPR